MSEPVAATELFLFQSTLMMKKNTKEVFIKRAG